MEEKNELNDIILNKGASNSSSKKVLVAVATLVIILIVVVVIMNRINASGTDNLPQAVLPPEPIEQPSQAQDPLFEPVEVIEEDSVAQEEDNLDKIAQKLKEESLIEDVEDPVPTPVEPVIEKTQKPKPVAQKKPTVKPAPKPAKQTKPTTATKGSYYIQVGSFTRFEPNKKFLNKISAQGYTYQYHKVSRNGKTINKVLVGPFSSEAKARTALKTVRSKIEKGAFLTKI
ncbi:MAG TPA: SPOR domain-containing protein [Helicobacteraceae bacterium]|nr:SPOR domain-containing protein [Helicobacteraceae bacterium]